MTPGPSSTPTAGPSGAVSDGSEAAIRQDPSSSTASAASTASLQRGADGAFGQPKICAHCGQQLDSNAGHSNDRLSGSSGSNNAISAPSPSSIAFAPDSMFDPEAQHQPSLTSAINAAAAAALSRHLAAAGPSNGMSGGEVDGQAVCSRCFAASTIGRDDGAGPATDELAAMAHVGSTAARQQNDVDMRESAHDSGDGVDDGARSRPDLHSVASRQEAQIHAQRAASTERRTPSRDRQTTPRSNPVPLDTPRSALSLLRPIGGDVTPSAAPSRAAANSIPVVQSSPVSGPTSPPRRQAPWAYAASRSPVAPIANPGAALSISVGNMGAGGDAVSANSARDADFPPLGRPATSPVLRSPTSPGHSPSRERGRLRFMPGSPPLSSSRVPTTVDENSATSPYLARSGSFSRSLSYNTPGHDGLAGAAAASGTPIVSFPMASGSQPVMHSITATPVSGRLRRSSSSSSGMNVPAPAGAVPGAAKTRRPSVTRRPSRSSSSTAATSVPFAAVLGASDHVPRYAIEEDPYGPACVTRPRLSTIPPHAITDSLAVGGPSRGFVSMRMNRSSSSGRDASAAVKMLPNPYRFPCFEPAREERSGRAASQSNMDLDPPTSDNADPTARIRVSESQWYDPLRPDPLMELSRVRSPPRGRGCLYPGAVFNGTQKSGRNSYDVTVRIVNVDMEASHLCGYLNIRGLTEDWPELTTYFDAEIIGDRHGFVTGKWGATEADDLKHWARFPPFRPLRNSLTKPGLKFSHLNKPYVFMRWKERFLVPDHRVRDINGASFAGFYYVCVELGDTSRRPTHHVVSSPDYLGDTGPGGWYAARSLRRRESITATAAAGGVWPPSPPANSAAASATYPFDGVGGVVGSPTAAGQPTSPTKYADEGREARDDEIEESASTGKMLGFYFHENSEPYQQLSLHHVHERSSAAFEMR